MIPRFDRLGLRAVVAGIAAWTILVSVLHVAVNHRASLARTAATRSLEVGGLPVT